MIRISERNLFIISAILLILSGCTVQKNYKVISFFFDGVPVENQEYSGDSVLLEVEDNTGSGDSLNSLSEPGIYYHYPYLEKECGTCHVISSMGDFTERQPDLCYQCHENYSDQYDVLHGPVAGGYCTSCHNPHQSENKILLIRKDRDLCLNCHNSKTLYNLETHGDLETESCLECHNPHGGSDRTLLL